MRKVKTNHPDLNPNDPTLHEKFLSLKKAYETLRKAHLSSLEEMTLLEKQELERLRAERTQSNRDKFMEFEGRLYAEREAQEQENEKLVNGPLWQGSVFRLFGIFLLIGTCFAASEFYEPDDRLKND